jgi:hypothetical protein
LVHSPSLQPTRVPLDRKVHDPADAQPHFQRL